MIICSLVFMLGCWVGNPNAIPVQEFGKPMVISGAFHATNEIGLDMTITVENDKHKKFNKEDYFPIVENDTPIIIDMSGLNESAKPESAAIQIKGEHHCLVSYNGDCIIMGNRLEIQ